MEGAVSQAKVEIAAAFQNIITSHGLQALEEKLNISSHITSFLTEKKEDDETTVEAENQA